MTSRRPETILIVDDNPAHINALFGMLHGAGFRVLIAEDGDIALTQAQRLTPTLVLMDVIMPGLDGFAACARLKELKATQRVPVMFMASCDETIDWERGFALGGVDYITWPFQEQELLARINRHLTPSVNQKKLLATLAESKKETTHYKNVCTGLRERHDKLKTTFDNLSVENEHRKQSEAVLQEAYNSLAKRMAQRTVELAEANATLVDEIAERKRAQSEIQAYSAELKATNEALSRLDRLKDEFLVNTSHELRTPLTGIIGIAESMIDGAAGPITPEQMYNFSMIVSSGRRLTNLINDLLDLSKLKNQELDLHLKPIDMRAATEVVLTLSKPMVGSKPIQLVNQLTPDLPMAHADEGRVQQILHNLVDNAIRFTDEGQVTLSARARNEMMEITVADTGVGLSPQQRDTILRLFAEDNPFDTGDYGGVGLGLAITKQLVELHGGKITVQSSPDSGTQFIFTLPLYQGAVNDQELAQLLNGLTPNIPAPSDNNRTTVEPMLRLPTKELDKNKEFTILVADDDLVHIQVLTNYLSMQNYAVTQTFDGIEALDAYDEIKPDLVLVDVMMPKMSGYEVCRKIRETHPANEVPILLMVDKTQKMDWVAGFEAGANDYLVKPFDKNELLARVKNHIRLTKISTAYGRFVPHEFLQFLGKESIIDVNLGDQVQRDMTVMFSDIRSFTNLSETMSPQENFNFLNAYLRRVSPIIRQHGGFIDKYIGDAVMALFPKMAEDALKATVEMQQEITIYNKKRVKNGYRPIEVGVGIHTGTLMLGTIGEEMRMESTVISDAVNLAARLEGLTKIYGASIVISRDVLLGLNTPTEYHFRFLDNVRVKGKSEPVAVFEVLDGYADEVAKLKLETIADFERGLLHYHNREFAQAKAHFKNVLARDPDDKAAQLYLKRTKHLIGYGVPPDWEGIETMTTK